MYKSFFPLPSQFYIIYFLLAWKQRQCNFKLNMELIIISWNCSCMYSSENTIFPQLIFLLFCYLKLSYSEVRSYLFSLLVLQVKSLYFEKMFYWFLVKLANTNSAFLFIFNIIRGLKTFHLDEANYKDDSDFFSFVTTIKVT